MSRRVNLLAIALAPLAMAGCYGNGAVKSQTGESTTQGRMGRGEYVANCSRCHGPALQGGAGPALVGSGFMSAWGPKSTLDLYRYISTSMPAGNPGSLSPSSYVTVTAFILQSNGANFGAQAYTATSDFKIATLVQGPAPGGP